jgi:hypothetical protein
MPHLYNFPYKIGCGTGGIMVAQRWKCHIVPDRRRGVHMSRQDSSRYNRGVRCREPFTGGPNPPEYELPWSFHYLRSRARFFTVPTACRRHPARRPERRNNPLSRGDSVALAAWPFSWQRLFLVHAGLSSPLSSSDIGKAEGPPRLWDGGRNRRPHDVGYCRDNRQGHCGLHV